MTVHEHARVENSATWFQAQDTSVTRITCRRAPANHRYTCHVYEPTLMSAGGHDRGCGAGPGAAEQEINVQESNLRFVKCISTDIQNVILNKHRPSSLCSWNLTGG